MLASLSFLTPLTATAALAIVCSVLLGFLILRWIAGPPAQVARRWLFVGFRLAAVVTLLLILLNPSDVTQTPGPIDRSDIFYLLDSSQSMAVGDKETRFAHATRLMRDADSATTEVARANVKLFRFGNRLAAVENQATLGIGGDQNDKTGSKGHGHRLDPSNNRSSVSLVTNVEAADRLVPPASGNSTPGKKNSGKEKPLAPTDSDTQLLTALRQISSRFGRRPPAGIVLFSDGRARDEAGVEQVASQFARLNVPVHVVPVGDTAKGGDVAIVACVVPPRARRFSEVEAQIFLRSYGYDGRRCEVSIAAASKIEGEAKRTLSAPVAVTLHDGFQSVGLTFRTEAKGVKLHVSVTEMPNEVSTTNNNFKAEIQIDRTKIRVLYVEGSSQPPKIVQSGLKSELRGPYSDLQQALTEDEDIECVVLNAPYGRGRLSRVSDVGGVNQVRGFPETLAELSAFDAIILSDIGANTFNEQQLEWMEKWIGHRGGGLLMVGGQRSFASGNWNTTSMAGMLPVEMLESNDWLPGTQVSVFPDPNALTHPVWTIVSDALQNREIVGKFPSFFGSNRWAAVKPNLTRTLATSNLTAAAAPVQTVSPPPTATQRPSYFETLQKNLTGKSPGSMASGTKATPEAGSSKKAEVPSGTQPAIVVGQYGRGRTMAMAMPITSPWANDFLLKWGNGDAKYFGKFWRNTIYWLTESSSIGRRRLVVTADKKFYRPGETITLNASAFDEGANQTAAYRISSMIEPQASLTDLESEYSPIRWPDGKARSNGETGPFIAWGEEFDLPRADSANGKPAFALDLPIADALTVGSANQSLRVELTAMEESTQVDSTSLDIQILHDPFEQQNPFPNHEFMESIARYSGGRVITDSSQLAQILRDVPMVQGTPIVKKTPLWSTWWLWSWLLSLLAVEWICRRLVGLA